MKLSEILKEGSNITIATVSPEGQPKSRIFSHQFIADGKIVFATSNTGSAFQDLTANPNAEISQFARAMYTRIGGQVQIAEGEEKQKLKQIVKDNNPKLVTMYTEEGFEQKMEVCYFIDPTIKVIDFKTHQPVEVEVE